MTVKASRVLELFLKSINSHERKQTMFTCLAVEVFSEDCVDTGIMQGYLSFLGTEHLAQTNPAALNALVDNHRNTSITLDDLVSPVLVPKFMEIGLKIFQTQVKFRSASYWKPENVGGVCLRFGVLSEMGDFEFSGFTLDLNPEEL